MVDDFNAPAKRILVTGASRGIGRATAIACGLKGWRVALGYLTDQDAADRVGDEIRACGGDAIVVRCNITEEADVVDFFERTADSFGGIDGVVINAGIVAPRSLLANMDAARLQKMFAVNVYGSFLCAREAARHLSKDRGGGGGSIVIISSAAARLGSANEYVDYAASKGAMDSLVHGLSKELGPAGVRVNGVRPGVVETEIHQASGHPERVELIAKKTPLGRAGLPEEIAAAVLWLLDDRSSYATGALLDVTGGL